MSETVKHFVDAEGVYIGAFDGYIDEEGAFVAPAYPEDAVEVDGPPPSGDGRQKADPATGQWLPFDPPAAVVILYPADLWRRTTDAEAEAIEAAIATQPVRIRNVFRTANVYRSDDELWPLLVAVAQGLFGEERAGELLATS